MAKRTYNRRGRKTASKPVTSDKGRKQGSKVQKQNDALDLKIV